MVIVLIIMYFIIIGNLMHEFTYRVDGSPLVSNILQIDFRDAGFWTRGEDLLVEKLWHFLDEQIVATLVIV